MSKSVSVDELLAAVRGTAAAFRSVTKLQPVGGEGDKVFPATFSGGAYATERRRIDGAEVDCVLVDSVQSESNRGEEALKHAIERGRTALPLIEVDFSAANPEFRVPVGNPTSLDVPHRLADAILRDSVLLDGTRFSKSEYAQRWGRSNLWNATAVYELCPTALVFGMWGSPEKPGGLGAKFERAFVSEILAVDVVSNVPPTSFPSEERGGKKEEVTRKEDVSARRDLVNRRAGFRIDPFNTSSKIAVGANDDGSFSVGSGKLKPSNLNHGNVPFDSPNTGIRFRYAEQTTVISLGAIRKLRFPLGGKEEPKVTDAGRAVLAALGLCAAVLASEANTSLRSRCHLLPVEEREWELVDLPGKESRKLRMSGDQAVALLNDAVSAAKKVGLGWMEEKLVLRPSPELVQLIKLSQEAALKDKGDEASK